MSKGPTIPRPNWPTARRCCRRSRSGETLECRDLESKSHTTQPPNRYSEATLTRALEEMGIGRPSTYASIIDTILARDYVFKTSGNVLVPTWTAFAVSQLLEAHLPDLVDYQFTAADGRRTRRHQPRRDRTTSTTCAASISATDEPGLKKQLENKVERDRRPRRLPHAARPSPKGSEPEVFVRVGRYGPFLEQGERRASIPDRCRPTN